MASTQRESESTKTTSLRRQYPFPCRSHAFQRWTGHRRTEHQTGSGRPSDRAWTGCTEAAAGLGQGALVALRN
eukprot:3180865-Prymnesium_polylepis.1